MAITVKYFAGLREQLGRSEDRVEYEDGLHLSQVWDRASGGRARPDSLLVAVNMEYVKGDMALSDGDEVAYFPAVTGG